jgi:hypothetical protein
MAHGPEHHIEHAEHAAHAAHDPFDRQVTITIAIVAALLAAVTLLSHRAHNATLRLQLNATDNFTRAANQWNYFQSKKNRQYLYETADTLTGIFTSKPSSGSLKESPELKAWHQKTAKAAAPWRKNSSRYREETEKIQKSAEDFTEKAAKDREASAHMHHLGDRYDMAELGVEIGLVLCSLALLTKRRGFWYAGMACGAIGVVLMGVGLYQQYLVHH